MDQILMDHTRSSMETDKQALPEDMLGTQRNAGEGQCCLGEERSLGNLHRAQHRNWNLQKKPAFSGLTEGKVFQTTKMSGSKATSGLESNSLPGGSTDGPLWPGGA